MSEDDYMAEAWVIRQRAEAADRTVGTVNPTDVIDRWARAHVLEGVDMTDKVRWLIETAVAADRERIAQAIEAARDNERAGVIPCVTFDSPEPFWLSDHHYDRAARIARSEAP